MQYSDLLLKWYDEVKRDLPWRRTKNPYHIWLSEIMLQQTRVETVKGYYARFLEMFPTVADLASAPQEQVLKAWEGLGYYSRARNLHKAAQNIVAEHHECFPESYEAILNLPGIGPYTAGAISSIALGIPVPAVDGNVYRVASRFFGIREDIGTPAVQKKICHLVQESIPPDRPGDYNQALMELGATLCSPGTPACDLCPWSEHCDACREGDSDLLPVHEKKRPAKQVDVAVCLLTWNNRIWVMPRSERMLNGLYVFWLEEAETDPLRLQVLLKENGLESDFVSDLGSAKHVFTHRIWNMKLYHYELRNMPEEKILNQWNAVMADNEMLSQLPFPTAVKAAVNEAKTILEKQS